MQCLQVVHLKRSPDCLPVDRSSPLGNPFHLRQEVDRLTVCRAHKLYLWLLVQPGSTLEPIDAARAVLAKFPGLSLAWSWAAPTRDEFMAALGALREAAIAATEDRPLKIGCYCAPRPCHGDNYVAWLGYVDQFESRIYEPAI